MKSVLFRNIGAIVGITPDGTSMVQGKAMAEAGTIPNAFLLVENGVITDFGTDHGQLERADEVVDATGRLLLPALCDSHTHLVYAAAREQEFLMKLKGMSYEAIAAAGGGIVNSAKKMADADPNELFEDAMTRIHQVMQTGTGAIEIKSGYGLSVEGELKMLRVIQQLKEAAPIPVKATFLGAHALPPDFRENREGYVKLLIEELLPVIAAEQLADFIDCFCEKNYFTVDDTSRLMAAGAKYGLKAKVHVNQFNALGGIAAAVAAHALSVDHLEQLTQDDIEALKGSSTMPTALPGCSLFLNIPYTPGRHLIDAGLPLALASDYNPGSCPSGNMQLVMALGCSQLRLLPDEALHAATINSAYAMDLSRSYGSIEKGKKANLLLTQPATSLALLPYHFGHNWLHRMFTA
ncbi:MAG: imidazolonepropionase [Chitinophagales bacterium]